MFADQHLVPSDTPDGHFDECDTCKGAGKDPGQPTETCLECFGVGHVEIFPCDGCNSWSCRCDNRSGDWD